MGSGWKDWSVGETITQSNLQGYIQDQVVMTFASSSARDSALSGADRQEGMLTYIEADSRFEVWNGSAWVESGITSYGATAWTPSFFQSTTADASLSDSTHAIDIGTFGVNHHAHWEMSGPRSCTVYGYAHFQGAGTAGQTVQMRLPRGWAYSSAYVQGTFLFYDTSRDKWTAGIVAGGTVANDLVNFWAEGSSDLDDEALGRVGSIAMNYGTEAIASGDSIRFSCTFYSTGDAPTTGP